jgi:site-specific DNA-methyltransferase (adenine-specific)
MKPFHQDKQATLFNGDCREVLAMHYGRDSMDAIIADPPYGLKFMGKAWDHDVPGVEYWKEFVRVAKPGAHMLAFGGTRTFHRLAVAIEDAGWEIRDTIMWVYGSGFPKSHNLKGSRAGWGTALKPAWEPILLCRKPLDGTVAANVQRWGTGAINVDACRVGQEQVFTSAHKGLGDGIKFGKSKPFPASEMRSGRWPANLIHDGSDEVLAVFPEAKGAAGDVKGNEASQSTNHCYGIYQRTPQTKRGDSGSAARFFYCAKASKADRDEGLTKMALRPRPTMGDGIGMQPNQDAACNRNHHPTVKPTSLMRYLCRLITPPGGIIFDGFMGSGSTGKAAVLEGFRFVGTEIKRDYATIARARVKHAVANLQSSISNLQSSSPS